MSFFSAASRLENLHVKRRVSGRNDRDHNQGVDQMGTSTDVGIPEGERERRPGSLGASLEKTFIVVLEKDSTAFRSVIDAYNIEPGANTDMKNIVPT